MYIWFTILQIVSQIRGEDFVFMNLNREKTEESNKEKFMTDKMKRLLIEGGYSPEKKKLYIQIQKLRKGLFWFWLH